MATYVLHFGSHGFLGNPKDLYKVQAAPALSSRSEGAASH